jgi:tetratricopeptide (TPR) repeat protein
MSRGVAALGAHDLPAALEAFEQVVALAPSFAEGHNKRATCFYLMQRYKDSIEACKVGRGGGLGRPQPVGAARRCTAPAACPLHHSDLFTRALCTQRRPHAMCARPPSHSSSPLARLAHPAAPQAAIELNPYHFGAISGMGLCHVNLGQREEAVSAFEAALQINPGLDTIKQYIKQLKRDSS